MRKMDLAVSDGSEEQITDKENWVSKQKWPESDVSSAEEFEPWTTSPPSARVKEHILNPYVLCVS